MKNLNALSKAEMKKVMGGVELSNYCGEGNVYAVCTTSYNVWVGGTEGGATNNGAGGHYETHTLSFDSCMPESDYLRNQDTCRLIGYGGPWEL